MKNLLFRPNTDLSRPGLWGRDFTALQRAMEGLWEDMNMPSTLSKELEKVAFNPPCDIKEGDAEFVLALDIPGLKKDEISIEVTDGVLTISGERKSEHTEEKGKSHLIERFRGAFSRSFTLAPGTDASRVRASYGDGVLKVTVPKAVATRKQQVRIEENPPTGGTPMQH